MMIKVFTKDKDGKISMTPEELKSILDEAYWEGYNANNNYIYKSPTITWTPFTCTATNGNITYCSNTTSNLDNA